MNVAVHFLSLFLSSTETGRELSFFWSNFENMDGTFE